MNIPEGRLGRQVIWQEPGSTTNAYGDTVDDWTATTEKTIGVRIDQRSTTEQRDGRDVVVTGLLLLTNQAGISPKGRFVDGADTYEVDGRPWDVAGGDGATFHHAEIPIRRVEG